MAVRLMSVKSELTAENGVTKIVGTVFADTGNVDLTYNDLDIAKRGSFREVFKLPS